jgi:hypothetical protein
MTESTDNIILEHLRHIRRKVDLIEEKVDIHTLRLSSLEQSTAFLHVDLAQVNLRLDNFEKRLDRIEKRLDLIEE